tara:strand:- start:50 stop:283 length:234 start_codon:yes stop_codon:yes gene_type:complete
MNKETHSQKEMNKAIDGFTKHQKNTGGSVKSDSIFNGVNEAGKGDSPRSISDKFKNNYEDIFPNSFKPKWMQNIEDE